jgi:predicted nuclease of predicted toxin-antitoxin system
MRFLADENFNGKILAGLFAALPDLDIIRAQDSGAHRSPDPELLEWAAQQGRILLTHDVQTITGYAYDRVRAGLPMPGVIEVRVSQGIGAAIEDLVLLISASTPDEFEDQVRYVPLR